MDFRGQLIESGDTAAKEAKKAYENSCTFNSISVDPYESEYRQQVAYKNVVKNYRHGEIFLKLGLVGKAVPDNLDVERLNALLEERHFLQTHGLEEISKSLNDLKQFQINARDELKVHLENVSKNPGDFKLICKRVLVKVAEAKGQELNYSKLDEVLKNHTSEEIIEFVVDARKDWDDDVYDKLKKFQEQCQPVEASAIPSDFENPVNKLTKQIYDMELLHSTTNIPLTPNDASVQSQLEEMFSKPPKIEGQEIFVESSVESDKLKRSIQESQSTDSGDSPSLDPTDSKKVK